MINKIYCSNERFHPNLINMKKNILNQIRNVSLATLGAVLVFVNAAEAQMVKQFQKRGNHANSYDSIFHIQGDFAMIGNSNLTVTGRVPNDSSSNSNTSMVYNKLSGDPASIVNSSSADFTFRTENNSDLECTKVLFAGLYWTGRTTEGGTSTPMNWATVTTAPTVTSDTVFASNRNVINQERILTTGTNTQNAPQLTFPDLDNYSRDINGTQYQCIRYQLGDVQVEFGIRTSGNANASDRYLLRRRNSTGSGNGNNSNWTNMTFTTSVSGNMVTLLLDSGSQLKYSREYSTTTNGNVTTVLTELSTITSFTRDLTAPNSDNTKNYHRDGRSSNPTVGRAYLTVARNNVTTATTTYPNVTLAKNQIKLKGPGDVNYTQFTTSLDNIYYPTSTANHGGIYTGFVEVTDFVKARGQGTYAVADLASASGNGGAIGFFGGWSLVVVYENYKMEWRDISIFDGHGYIATSNRVDSSHYLPISGFKARQNGPVNIKMGIMAGEGDRSISGDYFQIWNKTTQSFEALTHSTNADTNFFNSSINLGINVPRVPNYSNNTGIDIAVFNLNNDNKQFIRNSDDSTTFRFGTKQDTYTIPLIVFGVDAYVPIIAPINDVAFINSVPHTTSTTILPGDTVTYNLVLKNIGAEAIENADFAIAVPFTTTFLDMSVHYNLATGNRPTPTFEPNTGVNGTIKWGVIDSIPKALASQNDTFAVLTYRLIATKDCYILMNPMCAPRVAVEGYANGIGKVSREVIDHLPFISGYESNLTCQGAPINEPTELVIDAVQYVLNNCATSENVLKFAYCETNATGTVPLDANITDRYPAGSKYYNLDPRTNASAIEYTVQTGIPYDVNVDTLTYFVIPPITSNECSFQFKVISTEKPAVVGLSQDCRNGIIIVTASPSASNLEYKITEIYNNPRISNPIPLPPVSNTGTISGLYGADSAIIVINNGSSCALTETLIFDECIQQLPVDFVSFDAVKNKSVVDLNWKVANEINVEKYIVQRSTNSVDFENVVTVKATEKSNEVKTYTSTDFKPAAGINYYRIKQVDFDGTFGYSVVRMVEFDQANTNAKLYPIPAQSSITLEIDAPSDGNIEYWTLNSAAQMNGAKLYQTITKGNNKITVDIAHYADGLYVLAYKLNNDDQVYYLKFSKNMGK